jgi:transcription elongation factor Elf1
MYIQQKYLSIVSSQLSQFKKKGDFLYNFRCPYCGDSQKSQTKARGFIFRKDMDLIYKCHNCGKGASFTNFLKYVDSKIHNDYIMERYKKVENVSEVEVRKSKITQGETPLKQLKRISQLEWTHVVKKFVQKRKIPSKFHYELYFAPKFYEWVNTIIPNKFSSLQNDHPRLVIPFFDEKGKMFALQGRSFGNETPKYITIILDSTKNKIYGLNRVKKDKPLYAVEGPIDSLFLDNCVAVAGAEFTSLPLNTIIIFDNDRRNKEVLKQIEKTINRGYSVVLWPNDVKQKDINDMVLSGMTRGDIYKIIKENTFSGVHAKTRFVFWKKVETNEKIFRNKN